MTEAESQPNAVPRKRRWLQYSLRTLLMLMVVVAIGMSYMAVTMREARRQKQVADTLKKAGVSVHTEPVWVGKLLGDDSLVNVTWVKFGGSRFSRGDTLLPQLEGLGQLRQLHLFTPTITDAGLVHLHGLKHLEVLMVVGTRITDSGLVHLHGLKRLGTITFINPRITDLGLAHLGELKQLVSLDLRHTKITDVGLAHLEELPNLTNLCLVDANVTDVGLANLKRLGQLRYLELVGTKVTDEGVKELQAALPKCKIVWKPPTEDKRQGPAAPDQLR